MKGYRAAGGQATLFKGLYLPGLHESAAAGLRLSRDPKNNSCGMQQVVPQFRELVALVLPRMAESGVVDL
jgi:hypothetical protein